MDISHGALLTTAGFIREVVSINFLSYRQLLVGSRVSVGRQTRCTHRLRRTQASGQTSSALASKRRWTPPFEPDQRS